MSWVAPDDFDPNTMFDAPIPRPGSAGFPRARSTSFGGSSLLGAGERASSPFGLNPREGSSRAVSVLGLNAENRASTALSVNYAPTKFSDALVGRGPRRRRRGREDDAPAPAMARGGGVDAFRKGESRMPDDRDDLHPPAYRRGWFDRSEMRSRWTRFKWVLFVFNVVVRCFNSAFSPTHATPQYTFLALAGLIAVLLIWLDCIKESEVIRVANHTELICTTLAASVAVFTAVFGWAGVMLNNRSFLALYCLFLWVSFAFLVTPGYITYKRASLNLQGKVNFQWSETFDIDARRRIQNALGCCGYFSPFVEASISSTCYARSVLPGCTGPYFDFEKEALKYTIVVVEMNIIDYINTLLSRLSRGRDQVAARPKSSQLYRSLGDYSELSIPFYTIQIAPQGEEK